ncbi:MULTISPECIES: DinB family protein [unclassified Kaistella]|uniref:DinB family protein n=1 Tax=unclassified Kaistella TaxID=2762626 RepID=UPI002734F525|nr:MULTISPECIES: DinB family protein [unclassified Kaistella]MDP2455180.1 DinB family protein [Kaistella sp. SH11-4b]MDP2458154.1 DinB family protein [Kaistella sp. SH40-3]MDP2460947.1 DinB family protein [Kaistella sp. SH19-2b]
MKNLFIKRFQYYKELAEKTFDQISEENLFWKYNEESNSIATIVKHLAGNMQSRWTNFLTEDGEKIWRNRDSEFENDLKSKTEMLEIWHKAWSILFEALNQIQDENWNQFISIRDEKITVLDAVIRQIAHYPYHVGQIVYIGKMLKNEEWKSLSIAKNKSEKSTIEMLKNQESSVIQENSSPVCFAKSDEVRDDYKI